MGVSINLARSTEGLELSRPGHPAVEIGSDFSPSVDRGAVIRLKHKEYAYSLQELFLCFLLMSI